LQKADFEMELNTRGRYAVMAMADLAKFGAGGPVPLPEIAERQQISLPYLEQIFIPLRRENIVKSQRGRSGGYRLAKPSDEISIAEIITAVGEPVSMTRCSSEIGMCLGDHKCLTHELWRALGVHIVSFLADISLNDVLEKRVPLWPVSAPPPVEPVELKEVVAE